MIICRFTVLWKRFSGRETPPSRCAMACSWGEWGHGGCSADRRAGPVPPPPPPFNLSSMSFPPRPALPGSHSCATLVMPEAPENDCGGAEDAPLAARRWRGSGCRSAPGWHPPRGGPWQRRPRAGYLQSRVPPPCMPGAQTVARGEGVRGVGGYSSGGHCTQKLSVAQSGHYAAPSCPGASRARQGGARRARTKRCFVSCFVFSLK